MGDQPARMTKGERAELGQLIRKRERVLKAAAEERSAQMLAEFNIQLAAIYRFDDDEVWKEAHQAAEVAVNAANEAIAARCVELGIPREFAPGVGFGWYDRGQNAVANRRAELRRAAKSRIQVIEKEARTRIERMSLEAQTAVIANGLESAAAKLFLEQMPPIEALMPPVDAEEIKALIDARHKKDDWT